MRLVGFFPVLLLAFGCAGQPAPSAAAPAAAPAAPGPATHASPDEILQARLRKAVADIGAAREARSALLTEEFGMIGASPGAQPPAIRAGETSVSGRLAPEEIQRIVRTNFGRYRLCYESGLAANPNLRGKVTVSFVIGRDGTVANQKGEGDLPDKKVVDCVTRAFSELRFPAPEGGVVRVVYPLAFSPESTGASSAPPAAPALAAPSAEAPARRSPSPAGPWPIVVVEGTTVRLNGVVVADTKAIDALQRLQKVDGLFDAVKARREEWKVSHPGEAFPGVAGLRVSRGAPLLVFKSVFQTMAFAGYPNIHVQSAEEPSAIVELAAQIPGPPPDTEAATEPPPVLHVHVEQAVVRWIWKRRATVIAEESAARSAPDLGQRICVSWRTHGAKRGADDPRVDPLVLHVDSALRLSEISAAANAIGGCKREVRGGASVPVFWLTFSVR